jgi:hypothetical protein
MFVLHFLIKSYVQVLPLFDGLMSPGQMWSLPFEFNFKVLVFFPFFDSHIGTERVGILMMVLEPTLVVENPILDH